MTLNTILIHICDCYMMCADGEAAHDQTQLRDQVALHMPQGKQFFFHVCYLSHDGCLEVSQSNYIILLSALKSF